jgi:hypothetical protein
MSKISMRKNRPFPAILCCLCCLAVVSCSKAVPETVTVSQTVTVVRTATPTKPATTPKLSNVPVSLAVTPPNEYAAYSLPIYITTDKALHLSWKSDGGGFQMKVINPAGEITGTDMTGVSDQENENELDFLGGFVFSPADYTGPGWVNGFYYFVPQIRKGQGPVKITFSYWLESYTPASSGSSPQPSTSKPPASDS